MLLDDVRAELPGLRAQAESLMTSQWRIERDTGEMSESGYSDQAMREVVYEGRGKLQTYEGYEQSTTIGPSSAVVQRMQLHLPVSRYKPQLGDIATCMHACDPGLVGRRFRVAQTWPVKDFATAYRVSVDEIVKGV